MGQSPLIVAICNHLELFFLPSMVEFYNISSRSDARRLAHLTLYLFCMLFFLYFMVTVNESMSYASHLEMKPNVQVCCYSLVVLLCLRSV